MGDDAQIASENPQKIPRNFLYPPKAFSGRII